MSHAPRNWFNSNQLQVTNVTHNAAGLISRVNNVGNFILDPGVSSAFTFSYSPSGLVALTNAGNIRFSTVSGNYILGDGAGANLPPDNGAPAFSLVLDANGVIGKSTLAVTDTNFFHDDITQTASRTHDAASFNTTINNVGSFIVDRGAGTLDNFFRLSVSGFTARGESGTNSGQLSVSSSQILSQVDTSTTQMTVRATSSGTDRVEMTVEDLVTGATAVVTNSLTGVQILASDAAQQSIIAANADGSIRFDSTTSSYIFGDGLGARLPPDQATPTHFLTLNITTGAIEKSTVAIGDSNFFNDNLIQDANRSHDAAGFDTIIHSIDSWTFNRGTVLSSDNRVIFDSAGFRIDGLSGGIDNIFLVAPNIFSEQITDGTDVVLLQLQSTDAFVSVTNGVETGVVYVDPLQIVINSTNDTYILGDGAGGNVPPTDATPDFVLTLTSTTGRIEKIAPSDLVTFGGGAVASSLTKELTINEYEIAEAVAAAAAGQKTVVIPLSMNGLILTDVTVGVRTPGDTGGAELLEVNVHRLRAGAAVAMMSSPVTLGDGVYFNNNGTIDGANDDIQTGDELFLAISYSSPFTITDPMGLAVTLTFGV